MEQQQSFESSSLQPFISEDGKKVTETEYWQNYYEHEISYEWNNGILEEKPMGDEKGGRVYNWLLSLFREYFKVNPIGRVVNLETGFKIRHPTKVYAIRKPDLGVILHSNPVPFVEGEFTYEGCFDLCVESLSFSKLSEIKRDTIDKKREYARTQVKEYFIFDSRGKETAFYCLNDKGSYERLPIIEGVVASKVLPGFQFRVSDLDDLRETQTLMDDPVYSSYVEVALQETRRREKQERQAKEMERQAKEMERQAKEKAEKLVIQERQAKELERQGREKAEKQMLEEKNAKEMERQAKESAEKRILELEARLKQLDSKGK